MHSRLLKLLREEERRKLAVTQALMKMMPIYISDIISSYAFSVHPIIHLKCACANGYESRNVHRFRYRQPPICVWCKDSDRRPTGTPSSSECEEEEDGFD